ncbi:agmatine deiminase family protein [bacterium]|nr:agmatine deiminase family protein [bacterium]
MALLAVPTLLAVPPAAAEWDVDGIEELLPRGLTPAERALRESRFRLPPQPTVQADPPPAAPVRNCAEWEPTTGVLIRYPLGLPYNLLRDWDDVTTIYVVVSTFNQNSAKSNFVASGVDTSRVEWLVRGNNSIWTRDYGPWFVFDGNGDIAIIDHVYNRPRPLDDLIPVEFANEYGFPVIRHDMWHTGGNYMTDGAHLSMSTDLVYNEALSANGLSPSQVNALMNDYYGIDTYNVVQDISPSGIHHIDTWGKMLDEETILVKETVTSHSTYTALENRVTLIESLPASTGRNYEVARVFCPNTAGGQPASYTNSLILNEAVYVPLFGGATYDSAAMDVYRAAMPGYDVRGYAYGGFLTDDALHCRAKGVMDSLMLRVAHVPVVEPQAAPVLIQATIDDRSEAGITRAEVHYRIDGGGWTTLNMTNVGGDDYEATVPHPGFTSTCDYYVHAADATGRQEGMPRSEPAGWTTFGFQGANDAPVVAEGGRGGAAPNPFRNTTTFAFELRTPDHVSLEVFDVRGARVRTLVDAVRPGGRHEIVWDGRSDSGARLAAGTYFFRLQAAGIAYSRPVTLLR